jgi:hypothetical protein
LTVTDIATGWTEERTVRNKAAKHMFCSLLEIQAALPFPLLGIDSDNGSEFINEHLLAWCQAQQITFTRSRPANSNDGCHVEQKNWDIARRTVGYWRYDTAGEVEVLNRIWPALSPLINLFTPQQKLATKVRVEAKVTKTYDTAQTPYQRPLAHPNALDEVDARRLADLLAATNPRRGPAPGRRPMRHPAGTGPPQNRHPPRPDRSRLPITNQDQQDTSQAGILKRGNDPRQAGILKRGNDPRQAGILKRGNDPRQAGILT